MDELDIYQHVARQRELRVMNDQRHLVKIATSHRPAKLRVIGAAIWTRLYAFYRGLYNQRPVFDQPEKPPVLKSRPR